jgi:CubicO group peptidase (beta-lactamase class C family)
VLQSVPGGSHWGGGIWISSRDHARFGLLLARHGRWQERQLLAADWSEQLITPCPIMPVYGYLWWLNTGRRLYPGAPESSFFAIGAGSSMIWIDVDLDLVVVARWIDQAKINAFCGKVMDSLV